MNKKTSTMCALFCLLAGLSPLKAQVTKYWVGFKNKTGSPYVLSNANAFLSPKSINRRVYYNLTVDVSDVPVNPSYIMQVDNVANVSVLYAIKWLNGVVVAIPNASSAAALNAINTFSFVANSSQVNRLRLDPLEHLSAEGTSEQESLRAASSSTSVMGGSRWQNMQVNVDCLHDLGYRGQGMTIAVMDEGFNNVDNNPLFDSLRNRGGILGTRDFVTGDNNVYNDGPHGAHVLSCMAAIKPNVIMGSAPMANYWLLRSEEGAAETLSEEYNWIRAAEFADSVGVDVLTTSLGYTTFDNASQNHNFATLNGKTAPMSIAATMAARKGMFVLNAAGNGGGSPWPYISVPGDADSVCTVGAIDSLSNVVGFSSVGPTADGRIKPDLVARGGNAWLGDVSGVCFPGNGTSFATPILAGAVACFWQAHREFNNIKVLQLLKSSASNAAAPDTLRGWGTPDVCAAAPLGFSYVSAAQADFSISPNPFGAAVTVNYSRLQGSPVAIELADVLGRVIQSVKPEQGSGSITLNTAQVTEGVYFIRVITPSGISSKKIVKQ